MCLSADTCVTVGRVPATMGAGSAGAVPSLLCEGTASAARRAAVFCCRVRCSSSVWSVVEVVLTHFL